MIVNKCYLQRLVLEIILTFGYAGKHEKKNYLIFFNTIFVL